MNFREELTLIFFKVCHETERESAPEIILEANITLVQKPDKDSNRKENYRPICLLNILAKTLIKILACSKSSKQ